MRLIMEERRRTTFGPGNRKRIEAFKLGKHLPPPLPPSLCSYSLPYTAGEGAQEKAFSVFFNLYFFFFCWSSQSVPFSFPFSILWPICLSWCTLRCFFDRPPSLPPFLPFPFLAYPCLHICFACSYSFKLSLGTDYCCTGKRCHSLWAPQSFAFSLLERLHCIGALLHTFHHTCEGTASHRHVPLAIVKEA